MHIRDYIRKHGLKHEEFAKLGGWPVPTVRKWINGQRVPRPLTVARIRQITNGEVTADDFAPDAPEQGAAA